MKPHELLSLSSPLAAIHGDLLFVLRGAIPPPNPKEVLEEAVGDHGPCADPEYRSALPPATEYRRFCPRRRRRRPSSPPPTPRPSSTSSTTPATAAATGPPCAARSSARPTWSASWPRRASTSSLGFTSPPRWRRTTTPGAEVTRNEVSCRTVAPVAVGCFAGDFASGAVRLSSLVGFGYIP
uniref:Uncharacterized protein n=1 Tax=Ananas comosus var. bracteatus TaxID=296719 RepID=A0A6V7PCC7_ANACO|nr:unnamed protein product [Ananas comosus var. bracteatus]